MAWPSNWRRGFSLCIPFVTFILLLGGLDFIYPVDKGLFNSSINLKEVFAFLNLGLWYAIYRRRAVG